MRELARFLMAARKVDPEIQSISDVIHPQEFKVAIKSTQILCSYSEDTNRYGNTSLALKMGHQLKNVQKKKNQHQLLMETLKKPQGQSNFYHRLQMNEVMRFLDQLFRH